MSKSLLIASCLILILHSSIGVASVNNVQKENTPHSKAVILIDDAGRKVQLEQSAKRIIALAPHIIENLYSIDAGKKLVATVDFANFPAEAKSLPNIGGYNNLNIEKIIELKPDLVIGWKSGVSAHFINKIDQLGIPLYLDEADTLEDIASSLINLGYLSGKENYAKKVANQYLTELENIRNHYQQQSVVRVFYQVWPNPLYTINGNQIISHMISLCGGKNIFANETIKAPIVNIESVIYRNPQAIITGSHNKTAEQALGNWRQWQQLSAVTSNNLFVVNPDLVSRQTIRVIQGITSVCQHLQTSRERIRSQ